MWMWFVHLFIGSYCVRVALQQKIDGSVYIFVAIMEGYHALILSFPSYLNKLCPCKTEKHSVKLDQHMMQEFQDNMLFPENSFV